MIVECKACNSRFKLDDAKAEKGGRFKCSKCGEIIEVKKATGRPKKIVVADDTALFRFMMEDLLVKRGYEVITAKDGEDALSKVKHELPDLDLLLLDMVMPRMDGFAVIRELNKGVMGKNLPILTLSGVIKSDEDKATMREMGVRGYIDKSTPPEEIIRRVDMLLRPELED